MSTIDDLKNTLETLAQETEEEANNLKTAKTSIGDKGLAIAEEISSSSTGTDVNTAFSAAVIALEEAIEKLTAAADAAQSYAEALHAN